MTHLERLAAKGIRRLGSKKSGFRYALPDGSRPSAEQLARIRSLVIPPAWTEVATALSPSSRVQAIGKDARGRWQYRYHPAFREEQEAKKFKKLLAFAGALPKLRKAVQRDLAGSGLGRERVMACILRILSTCFIRPGSQAYARENGSYGLATIRPKHVTVRGDVVTFDFPGKSGKRQVRTLRDRTVARIVRSLLAVPAPEVFKFQNEEGEFVDVKRRHINAYIKEVMGERFSAKDFRTWAGTLICACALARAGFSAEDAKTARKKKVVAAIKETASVLGNTPAICKASYIYPSVLSAYEKGRVVERAFASLDELVNHRRHGLHASEKALLTLLRSGVVEKVVTATARRRAA
jgi:DNA topoisomerase-1